MIIHHNPDEWEVESGHTTCAYHKQHPGVPYAGCCCSGYSRLKRKKPTTVEAS